MTEPHDPDQHVRLGAAPAVLGGCHPLWIVDNDVLDVKSLSSSHKRHDGGSTSPTVLSAPPSSNSSLGGGQISSSVSEEGTDAPPPKNTTAPVGPLAASEGTAAATVAATIDAETTSTNDTKASTTTQNLHTTMTLCVLMASTVGCEYDEHDPPADVGQHLRRAGYGECGVRVETVFVAPQTVAQTLVQLQHRWKNQEIDCFVNLCDGAWDEPSVGMEAVELLEHKLQMPFTGAGTDFFEPSRLDMKRAALACGVRVPAWRFAYTPADVEDLVQGLERARSDEGDGKLLPPPLRFPLLVKHFSSYASVGLTKESKVWTVPDLAAQCHRFLSTYGGCLIEEFIEGREFTVLAAEVPGSDDGTDVQVVAYDPVECHFGPGEDFKHYHLKWIDYDAIGWRRVADSDPDLSDRLKALARNVFRAVRGRGYGRLDVRSDPTGEHLYFLEINPNCGIWYPEGFYGSADFILDQADPQKAHADFLLQQVEVAHRHWRRRKFGRPCEARYDAQKQSWGMHATRDLPEGAVVLELEERPLHVVSKAHVLKTWDAGNGDSGHNGATKTTDSATGDVQLRNWANFAAYCWPLSEDWFAMWSPNPSEWEPLNHSCDPNAWNEAPNGINVVARRPIRAGEEITMDYATFVGYFPEMRPFPCHCQSRDCRGSITGADIRNADLAAKYRGHTSSYVAAKAREFHGWSLDEAASAAPSAGGWRAEDSSDSRIRA